jgi:hypothetical protein
MRALIVLSIFLSACVSQEGSFAEYEGACDLSNQQKEKAWKNVTDELINRYPDHAPYCETEDPASSKLFSVVDGECRVYIACAKPVNGGYLLHGDWIVTINEKTQEVISFYDVVW